MESKNDEKSKQEHSVTAEIRKVKVEDSSPVSTACDLSSLITADDVKPFGSIVNSAIELRLKNAIADTRSIKVALIIIIVIMAIAIIIVFIILMVIIIIIVKIIVIIDSLVLKKVLSYQNSSGEKL